jgi:hypothetical protein
MTYSAGGAVLNQTPFIIIFQTYRTLRHEVAYPDDFGTYESELRTQHFCFVLDKCRVRFSIQRTAILTEAYCEFPQYHWENYRIVGVVK